MKVRPIVALFTALLLAAAVGAYAQQIKETNVEEFFGPGSGQGPRQGMVFEHYEFRTDGRMMGGYGMMGGYFNPDMADIAEAYKLKIEKVYLETKEARLGLDKKRRELFLKLRDQADRYKADKGSAREIVSVIKELDGIQKQVIDINDKAMEKIRLLSRDREKEFRAANDAWIKKVETDEKELAKYLDFIDNTAPRQFPEPMIRNDNDKDNSPPKD